MKIYLKGTLKGSVGWDEIQNLAQNLTNRTNSKKIILDYITCENYLWAKIEAAANTLLITSCSGNNTGGTNWDIELSAIFDSQQWQIDITTMNDKERKMKNIYEQVDFDFSGLSINWQIINPPKKIFGSREEI